MSSSNEWNELLAVDHFFVRAEQSLRAYDMKVLSLLYMPIIGAESYALYMALWAEVSDELQESTQSVHHHLMKRLDMSTAIILKARRRLEALGLIEVDVHVGDGDGRLFRYSLHGPLQPADFFEDPFLHTILLNRIGENQFQSVKARFTKVRENSDEKWLRVTCAFTDLYGKDMNTTKPIITPEKDETLWREENRDRLSTAGVSFDWELFINSLSPTLINKRMFTPNVKDFLLKIAYLYNVEPLFMGKLVLSSLTSEGDLDKALLQKHVKEWSLAEKGVRSPEVLESVQPAHLSQQKETSRSPEEQMVHYFESTSPKQFLQDLSGVVPTASELKLVEDLVLQKKLHPGVVNVLLHFVMLRTNMKLNRSYVEQVASQWSRKQITTVEEAIAIARKEHSGAITATTQKQTPKRQGKPQYNGGRKEVVPAWLANGETKKTEQKPQNTDELEALRIQLEQELKGK
ncbi:MAG: replication initiation and membrane attachment family protein [Bacilli bacterium]